MGSPFDSENNYSGVQVNIFSNNRDIRKCQSFRTTPTPRTTTPGPEVIKLFSCSTQLSMELFLLIIVKMPTVVGILTFISRKNSILGLSEPEKKMNFLIHLNL